MRDQKRLFAGSALLVLLAFSLPRTSQAEEVAHPAGKNIADMQFMQIPGMPTCATGSVQSGDPSKGPSIILAKMAAGCLFPWHWHTPTESVMMVSGEGRVEMKDAKSVTLRAGGFAQMPSHHVHQFSCAKPCMLYVSSDGIFDMHYVNAEGQELSPDEALKRVKETAAQPPK